LIDDPAPSKPRQKRGFFFWADVLDALSAAAICADRELNRLQLYAANMRPTVTKAHFSPMVY